MHTASRGPDSSWDSRRAIHSAPPNKLDRHGPSWSGVQAAPWDVLFDFRTHSTPASLQHHVNVFSRILIWDGCCLSLRSCSPVTWLPLPRESAPCLAHQAIAPAEASLSLLLRGLSSLPRVSSLVLLVSQHFLFYDHARAHSGVKHTSAVSPGAVRDPRDQPSSSPRVTSSRSPCIKGSSGSSSSPGVLLLLTAHGFGSHSSIGTVTYCIRLSLSHSRVWFTFTTPGIFLHVLITSW